MTITTSIKPNACIFSPVSEDVILKLIGNLSIRKATDLDGLSARYVRDGASVIPSPLAHYKCIFTFRLCSGWNKNADGYTPL